MASGGIGCIPHVVYSTVDETPAEEEAYLQGQLTVLDFGILLSTVGAALASLRLTARDTVLRERGEIFSRSRAPDGGRAVALCRP